jgi:hypothetical protein
MSDSTRASLLPRRSSCTHLIACACLVLFGTMAHSSNLGFLKTSPLRYFTQEDMDLMMKNAEAALDADEPSARREWSNPRSGASGSAEIKSAFTGSDGAPCKRIYVVHKVRSWSNAATHAVCKYQDRGWILHTEAKPAAQSPQERTPSLSAAAQAAFAIDRARGSPLSSEPIRLTT